MAATNIELKSIKCVNTSEPGSDEVYIKYSEDGGLQNRYPSAGYYSLSDGEVWEVNLPLSFKESVVVALYDNDTGNDDFLVSHTYYPDDPQPEVVRMDNPNGAIYEFATIPSAVAGWSDLRFKIQN